jgi:uncharacterized membrane protein
MNAAGSRIANPPQIGNLPTRAVLDDFRYHGGDRNGVFRPFLVKRFPFLDWMRGLAVVIMIECHAFNSFVRMDLRDGGPYVLSQFVGGMAAPLFLFMAGMTFAFQMESLERREPRPLQRWLISLKRAGYILGIAFLFRFTNWAASMPHIGWQELTKVDILNCMGVAMGALSVAAVFGSTARTRFAVATGLAVAVLSPIVAALPWAGVPALVQAYLAPGQGRGLFPFFPWAAYVAFGLATGAIIKRAAAERFDRLMQWSVLLGFGLVFCSQYFSNLPYSVYTKSNFWTDSPALILIRVGICLLMMAGAYLWTEYCAAPRWSWMQALGKNSLMVYWIHVMIVYGSAVRPIKRQLSILQTSGATVALTLAMVAMSAWWIWWKARGARTVRPAAAVVRA